MTNDQPASDGLLHAKVSQPARWAARALFAVVLGLWLHRLTLGLDAVEVITDWLVRGTDFTTFWSRNQEFQVQSIYPVVPWLQAWAWPAAPEWYLRAPSLVFGLLAMWQVAAIARRLAGDEAALWTAVIFGANAHVMSAATSCRPYALGLLLVTASMLALLRWLERGRLRDGLVAVVFMGLAANVHILLGAAGIAQLVVALKRRPPWRHLAALTGVTALFAAPVVQTALHAFGRRDVYSWPDPPTLGAVVEALSPPIAVLVLLAGAVCAAVLGEGQRLRALALPKDSLLLVALWCVAPPVTLAAVSLATSAEVFAPRYYIATFPAAAVLLGVAVASVRSAEARVATVVVAVALWSAIIVAWVVPNERAGWREQSEQAVTLADDTTLVLYHPPYIEAKSPAWLEDPTRRDYLMSPLLRYPVPGRVILGTRDAEDDRLAYLDRVALPQLAGSDRFLIVGWNPAVLADWLCERLSGEFSVRRDDRLLVAERRGPRAPELPLAPDGPTRYSADVCTSKESK